MSVRADTSGDAAAQGAALRAIVRRGGIALEQLWLRYFGLSGDRDLLEVEAFLQGLGQLPELDRDLLAHAANELLDELAGALRVPYAHPPDDSISDQGPLPALVHLLRAAPRALAGELGAAATAAGRLLGADDIAVYLVDYEQRTLVPLPGSANGRPPLPIESTLPGRAFRTGVTLSTSAGAGPGLWVPVIDGVERLGVLEVRLPSDRELADPLLREQCGWLANLVAHLVTHAATHGDLVDHTRRSRERTVTGELIWTLLPPLTAGSGSFTVAGLLEPSHDVSSDAFDYALAEDSVQLAIFDGTGHAVDAGLVTATALAASRAARRAGRSLYAQAAAVDDAVAEHFPQSYATGVLGQLDLHTGRLRYVAAGHPAPLLLRDGKVVGALQHGRRPPLGLGTGELTVGEAYLQRGDWLVLYTDGVTEARDTAGHSFGVPRLVDFLEREAAGGHPPPETVRRLVHAVLRHRDNVLHDDVTVLLARWSPPPPSTPSPGLALIEPSD